MKYIAFNFQLPRNEPMVSLAAMAFIWPWPTTKAVMLEMKQQRQSQSTNGYKKWHAAAAAHIVSSVYVVGVDMMITWLVWFYAACIVNTSPIPVCLAMLSFLLKLLYEIDMNMWYLLADCIAMHPRICFYKYSTFIVIVWPNWFK